MSIIESILTAVFNHPFAQQRTPEASEASAAAKPSVDVDAIMEELASTRGERLDWKNSVVDLLKTVGLDSSLEARKRLAQELHYQGDFKGTAIANGWLHDQVLKAIEENGGKLPEDLK